MKWNFKGKYYGYDVNNLPDDYLQWVVENARNIDMKNTAKKIIDFRKSGGIKSSSTDKKTFIPSSRSTTESLIRALCLLIATRMDEEDPFRAMPTVVKYVVFNEIPMKEMAEQKESPEPPESELPEDFNNPFLEGLE